MHKPWHIIKPLMQTPYDLVVDLKKNVLFTSPKKTNKSILNTKFFKEFLNHFSRFSNDIFPLISLLKHELFTYL